MSKRRNKSFKDVAVGQVDKTANFIRNQIRERGKRKERAKERKHETKMKKMDNQLQMADTNYKKWRESQITARVSSASAATANAARNIANAARDSQRYESEAVAKWNSIINNESPGVSQESNTTKQEVNPRG